MYCSNCGKEIDAGITYCGYCGVRISEKVHEPIIVETDVSLAIENAPHELGGNRFPTVVSKPKSENAWYQTRPVKILSLVAIVVAMLLMWQNNLVRTSLLLVMVYHLIRQLPDFLKKNA